MFWVDAEGQHDSHLTPQEEMADLSDRLFARALCLAALCGRDRLAQVARLDDRRPAVARLPASLDQDLIGLTDEPKDDGVARPAAAIDRVDGRFVRWERQEGQHLAEILSKLLAEVLGHPLDVPGDQRCTESLGVLTNVLFFHRPARSRAYAEAILTEWHPHLAVVDMDHDDSTALLGRLGASNRLTKRLTAALGLTRRGDLKTKLRAFDLGVDDILTMPFSPEELPARSIVITRRATGKDRPMIIPI